MVNPDHLSDLIGAIYDTTLDPARWPAALEKTAAFVGACGATLALHDTASGVGDLAYSWGDDPKYSAHYLAELARINPLMITASLHCEPGEVFSASQILPYDELRRTRVFREWMAPQGWGDFTHVLIEKSGPRYSHFGVANAMADSPADEEPRRRLRLLVPHVTRAVAIAKAVELRKIEAGTLAAAVDAFSAGVFLVRQDGTIVFSNASGRALLDQRVVLQDKDGILAARVSTDLLTNAIAHASAGDAAGASDPVAIPLQSDGVRYVAHVVSFTSGARREAGRLFGATAGVFVHKSELRKPTLIQAITSHFGLTQAESRVLFAILEVGGAPQTAEALGVSEETVKTHLKRLFQKTGTTRQAELVKIIGEFSNPMVS